MEEDELRRGLRSRRNGREPACPIRTLVLAAVLAQGLGSHGISADRDVTLTANDSRIGVIRTCNIDGPIPAAPKATRRETER